MVSEITSLNAVVDPTMMTLRKHATMVVTATESRGMELWGSTCCEKVRMSRKSSWIGGRIYFAQLSPERKAAVARK